MHNSRTQTASPTAFVKLSAGPSRRKVLRTWVAVFAVWGLFLTGILSNVGAPGMIQAASLTNLLSTQRAQLEQVQADVRKLEEDYVHLEQSRVIQEREIRRVLGYAAPDELIFDFSDADQL